MAKAKAKARGRRWGMAEDVGEEEGEVEVVRF